MVELSSKFGAAPGEAVDLIEAAHEAGLVVEGLSFHVGSQTTNFENYVQALNLAAGVFREAADRGFTDEAARHRRRLSRPLRRTASSPSTSWPSGSTPSSTGSSPRTSRSSPSRAGSWWPPPARPWPRSIGKAGRDGKRCYYIDDGVYHTFSGIIFDHCQYHLKAFKKGPTEICSVFGPTCDALDTISLAEELPELELGDLRLQREHRRLQPRLVDLVQRLPAGEGRARQSVGERRRGDAETRRRGEKKVRKYESTEYGVRIASIAARVLRTSYSRTFVLSPLPSPALASAFCLLLPPPPLAYRLRLLQSPAWPTATTTTRRRSRSSCAAAACRMSPWTRPGGACWPTGRRSRASTSSSPCPAGRRGWSTSRAGGFPAATSRISTGRTGPRATIW